MVLEPLTRALGFGLASVGIARRRLYRAGVMQSSAVGVSVISVGGVTWGGAGKTPVARFLAQALVARGVAVGLVHSGYGGSLWGAPPRRVPAQAHGQAGAAAVFGDEPVMLARSLPEVTVVAGKDKLAGARLARRLGASVVVVDDGLQHLRLHRDLEVLVQAGASADRRDPRAAAVFAARAFEPLREFAWALDSVGLSWLHLRGGGAGAFEHRRDWPSGPCIATGAFCSEARSATDETAVLHDAFDVVSTLAPTCLMDADLRIAGQPGDLAGRRVFVLAGVAAPRDFVALVEQCGARVVGARFVRDHQRFGARDLSIARASDPAMIVCTEKDLVRMAGQPGGELLSGLVCDLRVLVGAAPLARALDRVLTGEAAA